MGFRISQNVPLEIGSQIAQGAQQFVQAYQGQQARNQAAALQLAEAQAQNALRQAQIAEIRQKMAPVRFDLEKLGLGFQLLETGKMPESVYNKQVSQFYEKIDSPEKLSVVKQAFGEEVAREAEKFKQPQARPGAEQVAGTVLEFSPQEAEIFGKMVAGRAQFRGITQRQEAAEMQQESKLADITARMVNAKDEREFKQAQAEFNRETQIQLQRLRNIGKPGKAPKDEQAASYLKQIEEINKSIGRVQSRTPGLTELPAQKAQDISALEARKAELQGLYNQRVAGVKPAQQAAPQAPKAQPQAAIPSFSRSNPGDKDKVRKLKEGSSFLLDGIRFKIKNGAPVQE